MENPKTGGFWSDCQREKVHLYLSHLFPSLTNPAVRAPIIVTCLLSEVRVFGEPLQ